MAVRITSGARQITLGRCVFLFLASTALGYALATLLFAVGVPNDLSIFGSRAARWLGSLIGATIFTLAFRAFSQPVVQQDAA
jgi:hypothetical protein